MSAIDERLRVVEADWRELHRQNEMLMELNGRLKAQLDALTPCPHVGWRPPLITKCDLCAGKR